MFESFDDEGENADTVFELWVEVPVTSQTHRDHVMLVFMPRPCSVAHMSCALNVFSEQGVKGTISWRMCGS